MPAQAETPVGDERLTPDEARAIAKEAYIFNYPLVMMYRTMYLQAIDTKSKSYSGGFGKWLHLGTSSPKDTDIVSPNNDSPYSYAWVDLRAEPWVLTLPKIEKSRFYTSQWDDLWGFVLDNPWIGRRRQRRRQRAFGIAHVEGRAAEGREAGRPGRFQFPRQPDPHSVDRSQGSAQRQKDPERIQTPTAQHVPRQASARAGSCD